ncbi:MAG: glycosyl hydrolase family 28 protein [Candidatus Pedobacter colombiensis]|uniref:Glycosyl hydrolase family 28 protein n=1 Tax=Candidatus Pedobacter colombiensis TaxID=3121371 RepID=A0AAJ5W6J9_9SPHI|nr:glycosyl hydrolase family 28 protein [Pedobacter sp.]WEK18485.1 MAG: glycosyl hydrolase family 28 protein [Pedobacter sp.]
MAKGQYNQLPVIPSIVYNVKDLGAVGDNKTLNTIAIQKALDKARETGGKVLIPTGVYLCGPLSMYGKTELEIARGAVLRLRNDVDDFPVSDGRYQNLITIAKATDVKISGAGTIDGQGKIWWDKTISKALTLRRPQMLFIEGTQRIEITGVTFLNSPNTHVSIKGCTNVFIHDIVVQAPENSKNTDGINISAKNCTIEHCIINTGDDNIAINFGNRQQAQGDPEVKNMVIRNCTFGYGHGLSIGSFTSGGLSNLQVSNCTFDGTTSGIRIKTARLRGGVIDQISYENIKIKNSKYPIFISEYYPKEPASPAADLITEVGEYNPVYKNIRLKNIEISNAQEGLILWGIPESPIQNVEFENVTISAKHGAQIYNAKGITFTKSSLTIENGERIRVYNAEFKGLK